MCTSLEMALEELEVVRAEGQARRGRVMEKAMLTSRGFELQ